MRKNLIDEIISEIIKRCENENITVVEFRAIVEALNNKLYLFKFRAIKKTTIGQLLDEKE